MLTSTSSILDLDGLCIEKLCDMVLDFGPLGKPKKKLKNKDTIANRLLFRNWPPAFHYF